MSGLSSYVQNLVAAWINGDAMPSPPVELWVAFFDGDPTDAGSGGIEITTDIRSAGRVLVPFTRTDNVLTNTALVDFGVSDSTVSMSHIAIFDAQTSGNMIGSDKVATNPITVGAGTQVKWEANKLTFTIN